VRRRLASRIWKAGIKDEMVRWCPQESTVDRAKAVIAAQSQEWGGSRTHKRKRGREGRIILGSKRMRTAYRGHVDDHRCKEAGRGSKRSTRSEAEEEGSDKAEVRLVQPPEKRAKKATEGH
jgi:hypothetical protein